MAQQARRGVERQYRIDRVSEKIFFREDFLVIFAKFFLKIRRFSQIFADFSDFLDIFFEFFRVANVSPQHAGTTQTAARHKIQKSCLGAGKVIPKQRKSSLEGRNLLRGRKTPSWRGEICSEAEKTIAGERDSAPRQKKTR